MNKDKYFSMITPCNNCPFRSDIRMFLRPGRVEEIVNFLLADGTFTCHKTNGCDDETGEAIETRDSKHCAGALIFLEKQDMPNQLMRFSERLGGYDRTKLDMDAPVYDDECEMIEAAELAEQGERT